jgi:hypothetical protein
MRQAEDDLQGYAPRRFRRPLPYRAKKNLIGLEAVMVKHVRRLIARLRALDPH